MLAGVLAPAYCLLLNHALRSRYQRGRLSQFGFYKCMVPGLIGPFYCSDIGRAALTPVKICIAGVYPHRFSDELDPIPDANIVLAIESRQFAVAGMKDRTNRVAMFCDGCRPRIVSGGRQGSGDCSEGAAHMAGMHRSLDQFQARNTRQQTNHAIIDRHMRGKPDMSM
jgi:hypothetical protein